MGIKRKTPPSFGPMKHWTATLTLFSHPNPGRRRKRGGVQGGLALEILDRLYENRRTVKPILDLNRCINSKYGEFYVQYFCRLMDQTVHCKKPFAPGSRQPGNRWPVGRQLRTQRLSQPMSPPPEPQTLLPATTKTTSTRNITTSLSSSSRLPRSVFYVLAFRWNCQDEHLSTSSRHFNVIRGRGQGRGGGRGGGRLPAQRPSITDDLVGRSYTIDNGRALVSIVVSSRRHTFKGVDCERIQFPLFIAFAIAISKSEGSTMDRAVINIADKEFTPGLTYVTLSRVKKLEGILFASLFGLNALNRPHTDTAATRPVWQTRLAAMPRS